MPILNYTTSVPVDKSVSEIQRALAKAGAESVSVDYANGQVSAIKFVIRLGSVPILFRMPCSVDGVMTALKKARVQRRQMTAEHAARVAWRIVKDWTLVQLALVEAHQAQLTEVFLPYVVNDNGQTLFQHFQANAQKMLAAGEPQ